MNVISLVSNAIVFFVEIAVRSTEKIARNLKRGCDFALEISKSQAFPGENLGSIPDAVARTLPLIEPYL